MEKLNIAELLKDCPSGMELDCAMYENCTFDGIEDVGYINILVKTPNGQIKLSNEGCYIHSCSSAKCIIFPKGKTTWEGFQRPFKDGDVVTYKLRGSLVAFIYKKRTTTMLVKTHFALYAQNMGFCVDDDIALREEEIEFATEEEKQKLFKAIKDNGYKWNPETKTLEKLPKFKVGDRIRDKKVYISGIITDISDGTYKVEYKDEQYCNVSIASQDYWELVPNKFDITTLKPFESKVLVRTTNDDIWRPAIYGFTDSEKYYVVGGIYWKQCIPYEVNQKLLGTRNNCDEYYKTWE